MRAANRIVLAALLFLLAASTHDQAALIVGGGAGALILLLNPSSTIEECFIPGGTVVSTVDASGGDGNAITLSMTGNTTDFALSSTTPPANVVVVPAGILLADCNQLYNNTITATQP